jgi:hypothetical protein
VFSVQRSAGKTFAQRLPGRWRNCCGSGDRTLAQATIDFLSAAKNPPADYDAEHGRDQAQSDLNHGPEQDLLTTVPPPVSVGPDAPDDPEGDRHDKNDEPSDSEPEK